MPRVQFDVSFPPRAVTDLDLSLFVRALRRQGMATDVLIAPRSIYADASALLVDLTCPSALLEGWRLCEAAVFLSRSLATVVTAAAPDLWRPILDAMHEGSPEHAISKIRWRPSLHGGVAWVTPTATERQLRATRRVGRGGGGLPRATLATADISVDGSLGWDPGAAMRTLMGVIAGRTGLQLAELTARQASIPGGWRRVAEMDPFANPGRVRLYLSDLSECERVHAEVHGRGIQIGGDLLTVDVATDAVDAVSGNGRRGRGGRPPAP